MSDAHMHGMAPCPWPWPSSLPPFHAPLSCRPTSKYEIEISLITARLVWTSRIPDPYLAQPWPNRPADIDKDAIVDAYEYGVHFHFRFEVRLDANCQSPGR